MEQRREKDPLIEEKMSNFGVAYLTQVVKTP
jgi:hypothetical protein